MRGALWPVTFGAAVAVQLVVLYSPASPGTGGVPHLDKLVHVAVFALPVFFAVLARLPVLPVVTVMALHAPVSEVVQGRLLVSRSGDPWDAVADVAGVALGALAATLANRRLAGPDVDRW